MGCIQSTAQDIAAMEKKPGNVNEVVVFVPGLRIPKGTDFGKLLHASLSASMVEHLSALRTRIVVLATEEGLTVAKIKRKAATQHGGSTLVDLLLALEDYLPVLPGLAKFGNQLNDLVEFSWINQEDDEKAAVSKLEFIGSKVGVVSSPSASSSAREIQAPPPTSSVVDLSINEYDALVEKSLGRVLGAAEKIGGQVLEGTHLLKDAFAAQRDLLLNFKKCKQPDLEGLTKMIQPLNERIIKANALTEGRRTESFNHLKAVAESLTALAWVTYTGKDCGMSLPGAHVEESWQTAEFYNNKVLVEYRNKDSNHVEWAKATKELYVPGLRDFVKKFYPQGPVWNTVGADSSIPVSATAVKSGARPPPPPPPPLPIFESTEAAESSKEGMSAIFQEISRGESVTAGLKKVTAEMKTKNRPDRSGAVTVAAGKDKNGTSGHSFSKTGPPKLELQMGRKWVVENQIGKKNLVIEDCDSKQSVYIFGCKDSVLLVKGKVNNITVDKCTKTGVVFKDVVSACEIVNCNRVEVQCQGTAPTVAIDNTSGCQLYLSKGSLDASITTAKSSEVNVLVPGASDDADLIEHSLPEQFNHIFKDGGFVTSAVSHSGG